MNLESLIEQIVADRELHCRWLNTLSLMENTGARKIAAAEDKVKVELLMLKHAAEEARHAYYLKKQIQKIDPESCSDYRPDCLLAPYHSREYLYVLDTSVCRYLKEQLLLKEAELKYAAYLLVTYAIEVRADELYPVYQKVLDRQNSKVNVKSIIAEEEGHLEEMVRQLEAFSADWKKHAEKAVEIETMLFENWVGSLTNSIRVMAG